jgi:uncharacterized membrane protein
MTLYEALLFFHILAMAVWVGGTIMTLAIVLRRDEAPRDEQLRARFVRLGGIVGPIVGTSAAIVLGTGIAMVAESEVVELSQTWVWLGLALFGVSLIIAIAYFGPKGARIVAALEAGQIEEADRRARGFDRVAILDALVLIVITGVMVFKPGAPG